MADYHNNMLWLQNLENIQRTDQWWIHVKLLLTVTDVQSIMPWITGCDKTKKSQPKLSSVEIGHTLMVRYCAWKHYSCWRWVDLPKKHVFHLLKQKLHKNGQNLVWKPQWHGCSYNKHRVPAAMVDNVLIS